MGEDMSRVRRAHVRHGVATPVMLRLGIRVGYSEGGGIGHASYRHAIGELCLGL